MYECKLMDDNDKLITQGSYLHCHDTKQVLETDPNICEYVSPLKIRTPDRDINISCNKHVKYGGNY